jgi:hypothetical protein
MTLPDDSGNASDGVAPDDNPTTWRWLLTDQVGLEMPGPDVVFQSQSAAEDWLRESFEDLAEDGVATVSLVNGGHAVYGPMYLTADGDGPVAQAQL